MVPIRRRHAPTLCAGTLLFALLHVPLAVGVGGGSDGSASDTMRGEYGFLTEFDGLDEEEARRRVRRMALLFGVKEFEFYNAFEGYSRPPRSDMESWRCVCFNTSVRRAVLKAYTQEITAQGGRSWLGVVAMGTDPGDVGAQEGVELLGQHHVHGKALLDVVEPNSRLAERIAPQWAEFAEELGFSGIHWANVKQYGKGRDPVHIQDFLWRASPVLQTHGLLQTWNFLDGFGWNASLADEKVVAFPVWEVRENTPEPFDVLKSGVIKGFPGTGADTRSEAPVKFLERQWAKARCHSLGYLAVGDGSRTLQNDYYPGAQELGQAEIDEMRRRVITELTCAGSHDGQPEESGKLVVYVDGLGAHDAEDQRDAFAAALRDVYGYDDCHMKEVTELERPSVGDRRELAQQYARSEAPGLAIPFHAECAGPCATARSSSSQERLEEAIRDALVKHGIHAELRSAEILWEDEATVVTDGQQGDAMAAPASASLPGSSGTSLMDKLAGHSTLWLAVVPVLVFIAVLCWAVCSARAGSRREVQDADFKSHDAKPKHAESEEAPMVDAEAGKVAAAQPSGGLLAADAEVDSMDPVHRRLLTEKTTII